MIEFGHVNKSIYLKLDHYPHVVCSIHFHLKAKEKYKVIIHNNNFPHIN